MGNYAISRYADTIGDGSGTKNAIGDYSATGLGQTIFKIAPGAGQTLKISRMIVFLTDVGSLDSDSYGNGITLTNGIELKVMRGAAVLWDITDGIPITANHDWKRLCHDELLSSYGIGNESVSWRYTFTKDGNGQPITLDGDNSEELHIILNDDFSGLLEHYFRIGIYD